MVKGIGIDIADISRIETLISKYSGSFVKKVFTEPEITFCSKMANAAIHYAGRWAAKEAFYKALPASCQKVSFWKSIEIIKGKMGKPEIIICCDKLKQQLEKEAVTTWLVSISHERRYCVAQVLLM